METDNTFTASELIVQRLSQHGVAQAFGVVGGAIMYITDALRTCGTIRSTFVHHEQSAAIAAEAYGKLRNRPALVFATAGPGVTNTLTGVVDAYMDSVPMVLLVGDVRSTIAADFQQQRYNAPQEVNQGALMQPVVKHYCYLRPELDGRAIVQAVDTAFASATSGRMGPICISVPLDVQGLRFDRALLDTPVTRPVAVTGNDTAVALAAMQALLRAQRPLVLLGAGVRMSGATEAVMKLLRQHSLPYCVSIGAVDLQDKNDPLSCGCVGPTSQRAANLLLQAADCVLAMGTSFDQSVTGFNIGDLVANKQVYLVNVDPGEFLRFDSQTVKPVVADLADFCKWMQEAKLEAAAHGTWLAQCAQTRVLLTSGAEAAGRTTVRASYLSAYDISARISECLPGQATVVLGISLDAHSVFNAFQVVRGHRVLVSRNLGPMGWDVPALLGAAHAVEPGQTLLLITGDGSLMVNIQELAVIAALRIPACIFVFNNDGYVSIRTTQANFFAKDFFGCDAASGLAIPALSGLARGFGLAYSALTELQDIDGVLALHAQEGVPRIVECRIDPQQLREPRLVTRMENGKFRTPRVCDMTPMLDAAQHAAVNAVLPGVLDC